MAIELKRYSAQVSPSGKGTGVQVDPNVMAGAASAGDMEMAKQLKSLGENVNDYFDKKATIIAEGEVAEFQNNRLEFLAELEVQKSDALLNKEVEFKDLDAKVIQPAYAKFRADNSHYSNRAMERIGVDMEATFAKGNAKHTMDAQRWEVEQSVFQLIKTMQAYQDEGTPESMIQAKLIRAILKGVAGPDATHNAWISGLYGRAQNDITGAESEDDVGAFLTRLADPEDELYGEFDRSQREALITLTGSRLKDIYRTKNKPMHDDLNALVKAKGLRKEHLEKYKGTLSAAWSQYYSLIIADDDLKVRSDVVVNGQIGKAEMAIDRFLSGIDSKQKGTHGAHALAMAAITAVDKEGDFIIPPNQQADLVSRLTDELGSELNDWTLDPSATPGNRMEADILKEVLGRFDAYTHFLPSEAVVGWYTQISETARGLMKLSKKGEEGAPFNFDHVSQEWIRNDAAMKSHMDVMFEQLGSRAVIAALSQGQAAGDERVVRQALLGTRPPAKWEGETGVVDPESLNFSLPKGYMPPLEPVNNGQDIIWFGGNNYVAAADRAREQSK